MSNPNRQNERRPLAWLESGLCKTIHQPVQTKAMARRKRKRSGQETEPVAPEGRWADGFILASCLALLVVAGILAYANSFKGVFVYDDAKWVVANAQKRAENPIGFSLRARRPLVDLSLALNYHHGKLDPWGYHLFNLIVHLSAAFTLFGVIRRSLLLPANAPAQREHRGPPRAAPPPPARVPTGDAKQTGQPAPPRPLISPQSAHWFAFAVALLWIVHPLQTQSVTYVIQRGESMMGLFYLLTLYCVIRSSITDRRRRSTVWAIAAVFTCACGMATKGVMVTAPFVVLLYDRIFLAGSFAALLRRRAWLYLGLAATWGGLFLVGVAQGVLNPNPTGPATVGFGYADISPWQYALTEPGVIFRYLQLTFWPAGQTLDYGDGGYGWRVVSSIAAAKWPIAGLILLLGLTITALIKRSRLGFVAFAFFAILAPTSSFIPIKDPIYEHRMYLSLAAVIILVMAVIWWTVARLAHRRHDTRPPPRAAQPVLQRSALACALFSMCLATVLGLLTHRRNKVYAGQLAMWTNVIEACPNNPRGHNNLGKYLLDEAKTDPSRLPEAIERLRTAVSLNENFLSALYNLGNGLSEARQFDEAIDSYRKALSIDPSLVDAHIMLGNAYTDSGRLPEAETAFRNAIQTAPPRTSPVLIGRAHFNLGNTLVRLQRFDDARAEYRKTIKLDPNHYKAWYGVGLTFSRTSEFRKAIDAYETALKINPRHAESQESLKNCREALKTHGA
jgi:cytochrome c-type biogenesis protein CcmH/NrfG